MSDTYRLSYARKKELYERRKRFGMLSDWYGEEYARTEITAHTGKVHSLKDDINKLLGEITTGESTVYIDLTANWQTLGGAVAKLTTPGGLRDGVLFLEVRHSALLRELQNISEILLPKLNERFGEGTIKEIRLISANRRTR
jgi:hypothetical protein